MVAGTRSRRQADNLSTIGVVDVNSPEQKAPSEEDLVTDDDRLEFTTLMKLTKNELVGHCDNIYPGLGQRKWMRKGKSVTPTKKILALRSIIHPRHASTTPLSDEERRKSWEDMHRSFLGLHAIYKIYGVNVSSQDMLLLADQPDLPPARTFKQACETRRTVLEDAATRLKGLLHSGSFPCKICHEAGTGDNCTHIGAVKELLTQASHGRQASSSTSSVNASTFNAVGGSGGHASARELQQQPSAALELQHLKQLMQLQQLSSETTPATFNGTCGTCNAKINRGSRFCHECGTEQLPAGSPSSNLSAPSAVASGANMDVFHTCPSDRCRYRKLRPDDATCLSCGFDLRQRKRQRRGGDDVTAHEALNSESRAHSALPTAAVLRQFSPCHEIHVDPLLDRAVFQGLPLPLRVFVFNPSDPSSSRERRFLENFTLAAHYEALEAHGSAKPPKSKASMPVASPITSINSLTDALMRFMVLRGHHHCTAAAGDKADFALLQRYMVKPNFNVVKCVDILDDYLSKAMTRLTPCPRLLPVEQHGFEQADLAVLWSLPIVQSLPTRTSSVSALGNPQPTQTMGKRCFDHGLCYGFQTGTCEHSGPAHSYKGSANSSVAHRCAACGSTAHGARFDWSSKTTNVERAKRFSCQAMTFIPKRTRDPHA
jgi:hypothetical protein